MSEGIVKIIYIAGKYSARNDHEKRVNIDIAREEAEFVWANGGVALCPHLNSAWMSGICPEKNFIDGYLEILKRCDALYTCYNWRDSKGAIREVEFAIRWKIPVLFTRNNVIRFLNGGINGIREFSFWKFSGDI